MSCNCKKVDNKFKYKNNLYCWDCLVSILEEGDVVKTWLSFGGVKNFNTKDDRYIGNEEDNSYLELMEDINKDCLSMSNQIIYMGD